MAILGDISGLGSVFDFATNIINKIFPDKTDQERALAALQMARLQGELTDAQNQWDNMKAQIGVNVVEAQSSSLFVSGWRPCIGWICAIGCGYQYIFMPFAGFALNAFGHPIEMPSLDNGTLMTLLGGLLGLGTLRTVEKIKGVSNIH